MSALPPKTDIERSTPLTIRSLANQLDLMTHACTVGMR